MSKRKKIRVRMRKNQQKTPQRRTFRSGEDVSDKVLDQLSADERISRKGRMTRHRTIVSDDAEGDVGSAPSRAINETGCVAGRVLVSHGNACIVEADDGTRYECAVRQVVWSIAADDRTVVVAGDRVLIRPEGERQGAVERVEERHGVLTRKVKTQKHVIVANVDQVLIVASAAEPNLKPSLIDRYLISAHLGEIEPVICINKADLVKPVELQPIVGIYAQLGYEVLLTSARLGLGISRLRQLLRGKESALTGQSGVGKTSLINAVEPGLNLRTFEVSVETGKGRHTTTNARLLELSFGGWVVDTPGIRQMDLWDVIPDEVEGYFREFHPFVRECKFPDCSHIHEKGCGIKRAVLRGYISHLRYESYCRIYLGDTE